MNDQELPLNEHYKSLIFKRNKIPQKIKDL